MVLRNFAHVRSDLDFLHDLLCPEGKQNTKDHNTNFAEESAPSVQRLERVESHRIRPRGSTDLTAATPLARA